MALHGGSLERGTAEIAREAADRSGASYYGVTQPERAAMAPSVGGLRSGAVRRRSPRSSTMSTSPWPSTATVGPTCSPPSCWADTTGRSAPGSPRRWRPPCRTTPSRHDLDRIPRELRGQNPANPVNLPRLAGAQIELPPRIRGLGPFWDGHAGPCPHTEDLIEGLATVARDVRAGGMSWR